MPTDHLWTGPIAEAREAGDLDEAIGFCRAFLELAHNLPRAARTANEIAAALGVPQSRVRGALRRYTAFTGEGASRVYDEHAPWFVARKVAFAEVPRHRGAATRWAELRVELEALAVTNAPSRVVEVIAQWERTAFKRFQACRAKYMRPWRPA